MMTKRITTEIKFNFCCAVFRTGLRATQVVLEGAAPAGAMLVTPGFDFPPSRISRPADLHGVVIVGDNTRRLSSGGLPEARVVCVAEDAL